MTIAKPAATLLAILLFMLVSGAASQPHKPRSKAAPRVVCSLDRPVVGRHQTVGVAAFTDVPAGISLRYRWKATAGAFARKVANQEGNGPAVLWDPSGAAPGAYKLSVRVAGADGVLGGCMLDVLVSEAARSAPEAGGGGLGSEAERDLLVRGTQEAESYGLYSYILLGARPDDSNRDRYIAVLQEYLALEDIRLETYFRSDQLNITYVPVDRVPPQDPKVDWVLNHYDYARARFLLARVGKNQDGDGPFIISALHPLEGEGDLGPYIPQNLSTVPISVIPFWMKQFRNQTTQQRVWHKDTIGTMALNLRTSIAVAAEGLPMVLQAVKEWIVIKSGP